MLRRNYTSELFAGFTPEQVTILAIAHANRGYLLIREKARTAVNEAAEAAALQGRRLDIGSVSETMVQAAEGLSPATADDTITAVIDTLPHWFALAAAPPAGVRRSGEDLGGVAQRAGAILSLEHAFRSVWQQALWEPWRIAEIPEVGYGMVPSDPDWTIAWRVWGLREQALHVQGAVLNRQLERMIPNARPTPALPLTVTAIDSEATPPVLTIARPSDSQAMSHRTALDALDDTYTHPFAGHEVGGAGVTSTLLSRAVLVLQDLVSLALPSDIDPRDPNWPTMERLACALPRETISEALARSLSIAPAVAGACVAFLTSDPATGLDQMFRIGVWHRPLIAMPGEARVLVVAGALLSGSPIRRTERWLQSKNGNDLSKTPNGLVYEAHVRASIGDALSDNGVIRPRTAPPHTSPKGEGRRKSTSWCA